MTVLNSILLVVLSVVVIATVVRQSIIDEYDNESSSQTEERIAKLEHKVALTESFAQCLGACRLGKSP